MKLLMIKKLIRTIQQKHLKNLSYIIGTRVCFVYFLSFRLIGCNRYLSFVIIFYFIYDDLLVDISYFRFHLPIFTWCNNNICLRYTYSNCTKHILSCRYKWCWNMLGTKNPTTFPSNNIISPIRVVTCVIV